MMSASMRLPWFHSTDAIVPRSPPVVASCAERHSPTKALPSALHEALRVLLLQSIENSRTADQVIANRFARRGDTDRS